MKKERKKKTTSKTPSSYDRYTFSLKIFVILPNYIYTKIRCVFTSTHNNKNKRKKDITKQNDILFTIVWTIFLHIATKTNPE